MWPSSQGISIDLSTWRFPDQPSGIAPKPCASGIPAHKCIDGPMPVGNGTGLGLSIVYEIVQGIRA